MFKATTSEQLQGIDFDSNSNRLLTAELEACKKNFIKFGSSFEEQRKNKQVDEPKNLEKKENLDDFETIKLSLQQLHKELVQAQQNVIKIQGLEMKNLDFIMQSKMDIEALQTLQSKMENGTVGAKNLLKSLEKIGIDKTELDGNELTMEFLVEKLVKNPESFEVVRKAMLRKCKEANEACMLCQQKEFGDSLKQINDNLEDLNYDFTAYFIKNQSKKDEDDLKVKAEAEAMKTQITELTNELLAQNESHAVEMERLSSEVSAFFRDHVEIQQSNKDFMSKCDGLSQEVLDLESNVRSLEQLRVSDEGKIAEWSKELEQIKKENSDLKRQANKQILEIKGLNVHTSSQKIAVSCGRN